MKNKELLNKTLKEISVITENKYATETDLGVVAGISGIALFQFYYSKYLDVDKYADLGAEMISHCIEKINEGYSYPTFCNGIAGFGWAIQHLSSRNFIDVDCDELLTPFDEYLSNQMRFDFDKGNYDFLHGALGYAFYFLSRYKHTEDQDLRKRYQSYLLESVASLEKLAISDGNGIKWKSILNVEEKNEGFNLSLSHGMSSILNYLSRLHTIDVFKDATKTLLVGSANYILGFENEQENNLSLFPSWVEKDAPLEYNSRIAWCYGDLGIGLSLFRAGKSLGDTAIQSQALKIFAHSTARKLPEETLVNDAGVCHGSYGNALVYQSLYQRSGDELYKNTLKFWIEDGIQKAIHEDGYAGYKQWNGLEKKWLPELSLLEGVAGIGLAIIDYLSEEPNDWAECLMIS